MLATAARWLDNGDTLEFGQIRLEVLHRPGPTIAIVADKLFRI
jgi:glyoxylase-like metal-dependent hydrolase (beta-lactamase superfamily II)